MVKFGFLGAHKLASGWRVVKQIQHFQRSTHRMRGRFNRHVHITPFGVRLPGFLLFSGTGGEREAGNGADTGQRFAAKSEAHDGLEIVKRGNFTGGMTRQRQRQLVFFNPAAVVTNTDKLRTTALYININARRTSINAVFHQLFHH